MRRPHAVRSAELHYYAAGGSVADPGHRDQGSLITLSVLLSDPSEYQGGVLTTAGGRRHELALPLTLTLTRTLTLTLTPTLLAPGQVRAGAGA